MFQKLIQNQKQPQLTPDQQKQMGAEVQAKAPTTTIAGTSLKDELDAAKAVEELARAQKELRTAPDKFKFDKIAQKDGSQIVVAYDQTDPSKPYIEIKSASGENAKPGEKKYANDGKLEIVAGIPTGRVMHGGKYVAPGQEGYTKADKEAVDLGMNAEGLSQAQKEKLTKLRGESFAKSRAAFTFHNVVDKQTGEVGEVSAIEMAKDPGRYSGASEQEKISARDAVHESLNTNFSAVDKDLDALPNGLDTETQAIVKLAMKDGNPDLIETILVNKIKQNAPDATLRLLTDYKALAEDSMTLRSVGGIAGSSDTLRAAMVAMVPGAGTSSVKEGKMQLSAARRTAEALFSGRPQSKLPSTKKGTALTIEEAGEYLKKAGGDKAKARQLAKADGRTF
jgi:hypothetical protein